MISLGTYLVLSVFWQNMNVYLTPKQLSHVGSDKKIRLGGLVMKNSLIRRGMDYEFLVHDEAAKVKVKFHGVPPALFREGQGIIAEGSLQGDVFVADRMLAKHDENYRPPQLPKGTVSKDTVSKEMR